MIVDVIIVFDEGSYLTLEITGYVIVVEQDAVLQRLMPALDLFLGLRMVRSAAHALHALLVEPLGQITGHDVAREVVKHGREIVPPPSGDPEWSKKRERASPPRTVRAPFSAYGSLFKLGPWP